MIPGAIDAQTLLDGAVVYLYRDKAAALRAARTVQARAFCGVVYGGDARQGLPSPELWAAMVGEFKRNGGRPLTRGKVRHLRRVIRRGKPAVTGGEAA